MNQIVICLSLPVYFTGQTFIEKWGTGTLNIIEWCKENGNSLPEWNIRSGSVVLIFKPSQDKTIKQPESWVESGAESGVESDMAMQILELLQRSDLSKKDIALKIGKSKPTRYLNDLMQSLLKKDVMEYTIPDKPNSRLQRYRLTENGKHVNLNYWKTL